MSVRVTGKPREDVKRVESRELIPKTSVHPASDAGPVPRRFSGSFMDAPAVHVSKPAALPAVRDPVCGTEPIKLEVNGHTVAFFVKVAARFVQYCQAERLKFDYSRGELVESDGSRFRLKGSKSALYRSTHGGAEPPGAGWLTGRGALGLPMETVELDVDSEGEPFMRCPITRPLDALVAQSRPAEAPVLWSGSRPGPSMKDVAARLLASPALPNAVVQVQDEFSIPVDRIPREAELALLHDEFGKDERLACGYVHDGCRARAHVLCDELESRGINNQKIFAYGDLHSPDGRPHAEWWFHTAPLVFVVAESGNIEPRVLDPSVASRPLRPEEWAKLISRGPVKFDLVERSQFSPSDHFGREWDFAANLPAAKAELRQYSRELAKVQR